MASQGRGYWQTLIGVVSGFKSTAPVLDLQSASYLQPIPQESSAPVKVAHLVICLNAITILLFVGWLRVKTKALELQV